MSNLFSLNQQAVLGANSQTLVITFLASFLVWFMFAGIIILWIAEGKVKKEQVLHAFTAAFLVWIITQMLKNLLPTVRPFALNDRFPLTLTMPNDGAFPSSHTAIAFSLAATLWLHNKKLGYIYFVSALFVGIGRIFANVHYLLDIVVGGLLGIMVAVIVDKLRLFKILKAR